MNPQDFRRAVAEGVERAHAQAAAVRAVTAAVNRAKDRDATAVVVLRGDPDRTQLVAAAWAYLTRNEFSRHEMFYVDLAAYRRPSGVDLSAVCRLMIRRVRGYPWFVPRARSERINLFRRLVADRKILVVLDNADAAVQVRGFIAGAMGSTVIVTSHRVLGGLITEGAEFLDLRGEGVHLTDSAGNWIDIEGNGTTA